jgi:hypothetical protein
MQIQSPLAHIRLSIDSIKKDGNMVRLDATQQPGRIPTLAYLEPIEVGRLMKAFLKPSLILYLCRLGFHQRRTDQGVGLPKMFHKSVKHPTPTPW